MCPSLPSHPAHPAVIFASLSAADLAHLARCAWQRQQGALDPARAQREFATLALWNAVGCRRGAPQPSSRQARP